MKWTKLGFGKYKGRTLLQILLKDPDWFFWAADGDILKGRLAEELADLALKARCIRIPKRNADDWEVEYSHERDGQFCGFTFVKKEEPSYGRFSRRKYLDLSWVRQRKAYDKKRCRYLIDAFRRHYFGENSRVTRRQCEEFFSSDKHFAIAE